MESTTDPAEEQAAKGKSRKSSQLQPKCRQPSWNTCQPSGELPVRLVNETPPIGKVERFNPDYERPFHYQSPLEDLEEEGGGGNDNDVSPFSLQRLLPQPAEEKSTKEDPGEGEEDSPFIYEQLLKRLAEKTTNEESKEAPAGEKSTVEAPPILAPAAAWFWQCHRCLHLNSLPLHLRDWIYIHPRTRFFDTGTTCHNPTRECAHTRCGWCFDVDENMHVVRFCSGLEVTERQYENFLRHGRRDEKGTGIVDPEGEEVAGWDWREG